MEPCVDENRTASQEFLIRIFITVFTRTRFGLYPAPAGSILHPHTTMYVNISSASNPCSLKQADVYLLQFFSFSTLSHTTCPTNVTILDFIIVIQFREEFRMLLGP
jgi:hypothetical protein